MASDDKRVDSRKVQRLGTSSLVVTLPKQWASKVKLKPGDTVYVIIEDDSLRIVPGLPQRGRGQARLELRGDLAERVAPYVSTCLYTLGYSDVDIKLERADLTVINRVLNSAARLLGAEAACQGGNVIKFSVVVDSDRIDINSQILSMVRNLALLVEALGRAAGRGSRVGLDDVELLFNELARAQHFVTRQIVSYLRSGRSPLGVSSPPYSVLLAASMLSQAGLIALRAAKRLVDLEPDSEVASWVRSMASRVRRVVESLGEELLRPSAEGVLRVLEEVRALREEAVAKLDDPVRAYLASKIEDFLDVLGIVALVVLCTAISGYVTSEPGGGPGEDTASDSSR